MRGVENVICMLCPFCMQQLRSDQRTQHSGILMCVNKADRFAKGTSSTFLRMTSQKKNSFATSKVKKKIKLTIDLLSLGIYAPGPQVLTYRPQILRGVRI